MKQTGQNRKHDSMALGVIFVLIASVCFGLQGVLVKYSYGYNVSIMAMMLWRKAMFLPFFWVVMLARYPKEKIFSGKFIPISFAVGVVGYYVIPMISFQALKIIGAGIERMVLYTFPAFVIIFNSLMEKRLPPKKHIMAFLVIQFGIFLLMGGASGLHILKANLTGTYLMMGDALVMAFYVIATQYITRHIPSMVFMLWAITGAACITTLQSVLTWDHVQLAASGKGFLMIFLTMSCSFPPAIMFAEGIKRIGGSRAALINGTTPMLTIVFAYLILNEVLLPLQLVGAALTVVALIVLEGKAMGLLLKRRTLINRS